MLYWIPYAFVRITVFFIAGILTAIYFPAFITQEYAIVTTVLLMFIYCWFYFINYKARKVKINPGLVGLLAIFSAGYTNVIVSRETSRDTHITHIRQPIECYTAVLADDGHEKSSSSKYIAEVQAVRVAGQWRNSSGKVLLNLSKVDSTRNDSTRCHYGDVLLIKGSPQEIIPPANPGGFDYQSFLAFKNIYHQQFLKPDQFQTLDSDPPSLFMHAAYRSRRWCEEKLNAVTNGSREQAIAMALVLGNSDHLDHDLMSAYSSTGSMHVLSVSGLHVGILYLIVSLLLRPLSKLKSGKWIIAISSLLILWAYAFIAGLSPSVLRAVTMFSFMVVARPLNQYTNIYNTLAASLFLILLFDPFLIMSVGLQLSYLALIGIIYLQPMFYNLFEIEKRWLDEVWKITSVSLAAQLVTFPLGLLYFHQFPNYFWLSNLFVIPLGFAILVVGLGIICVSFVHPLAVALGFVLEWIIKIMNYLIFFTDALPFSQIKDVNITAMQCICLFSFIAFATLLLQYKKLMFGYVCLISSVLFGVLPWMSTTKNYGNFTVYKISGASAFDIIHEGKAYLFGTLKSDDKNITFNVKPHWALASVEDVLVGNDQSFSTQLPEGQLTVWKSKRILQLNQIPLREVDFQVDVLILSDNVIKNFDEISSRVKARQIVIDGSNSYSQSDKLLQRLSLSQRTHVHSVWHSGAFTTNI
jgi:competence protein ComEC